MTLFQKLFGLKPMGPAGDSDGGGGGVVDRGDDFQSTEADVVTTPETTDEDDLKLATGEEDPPRDETGKFAKKEKDPEGATIPKSRFDSAVQKERERAEIAERKLAELAAQNGQVQRDKSFEAAFEEVKELRAQERKAMIQGDDEKAAALSEQADRLTFKLASASANDKAEAARSMALDDMRLEVALDNIEATYPELDENSPEFNQEVSDDVVDKQRGYMEREHLPRAKALLKAVNYVMGKRTAAAPEAAPAAGLRAATTGQDRKTAAVTKNLAAAGRQPASTKPLGADSDKHGQTAPMPDASQMSFSDFSALPEATKAKMRGDFVQ